MSQGDTTKSPKSKCTSDKISEHQILITKASSSPPRSRSQSASSVRKEALLFFEKHQLFQGEDNNLQSSGGEESVELLRKRSVRGRSHSQPSQVLLNTERGYKGEEDRGGSGDILCGESGSKRKYTSSWLEQVQFTAQYQHYRTNDYSSVVNSASSLDKVDQGGGKLQIASTSNTPKISPNLRIVTSRETQSRSRNSTPPKTTPPPLCFSFPKVKLPRIFNAKSLDDIFGSKLVPSSSNTNSGRFGGFSTTSSSNSPWPHNNCVSIDREESSQSSVGITTPGITNTTGGTTVTETGFTTTSGYFSDLDRRESCDLLVIDQEEQFSFSGEERRRNSSLTSGGGGGGGESFGVKGQGQGAANGANWEKVGGTLPPLSVTLTSISTISVGEKAVKGKAQEKTRKHSGSSLKSTLTSALLRIPPFSGSSASDKKSPKPKKSPKLVTSKSLSSGSLNKITVFTGLSVAVTKPTTASNTTTSDNTKGAKITSSDNYLNRIVTSTSVRFGFGSKNQSQGTDESLKSVFHKKRSSSQSQSQDGRSSVLSDNSSTVGEPLDPQPQQRKWTAVKQKWDLKLQLKPQEGNDTSEVDGGDTAQSQHLLYIKSQLGGIITPKKSRRSLDELEGFIGEQVQPHEPGRVSFRLEPEEIPDSGDSDTPVISRSVSKSDTEQDSEDMTKSQHFHYIPNPKRSKAKIVEQNQNVGQSQGEGQGQSQSQEKEKCQLVVANVTFLQRPTSPCMLQSTGTTATPTPTSTCAPTPTVLSPVGNLPLVGMGGAAEKGTKSSQSRNINEARIIGDNVNAASGSGRRACDEAKRAFYGIVASEEFSGASGSGTSSSGLRSCQNQCHFGLGGIRDCSGGKRLSGDGRDFNFRNDSDLNNLASPNSAGIIAAAESIVPKEGEELADETDKMGDLHSSTYVKKTIHMFNSIYSSTSTTQQNGSPTSEHNPSYLKVSKSVSGYSCLSYNNNAMNGTVTNGNSSASAAMSASIKTKTNGTSSSSASLYSNRFVNGSSRLSTSPKVRSELIKESPSPVKSQEKSPASSPPPPPTASPMPALVKSKGQRDGNYFLQEMRDTTKELQRLCDKVSPELETIDQQSERAGNILAAIGKSNLLIKKKFKQFEELCQANLRGVTGDEPATTNEDLAGFWDMVMIQVEQVYSFFKDIDENRDSSDVSTDSPPKMTSPRRIPASVPKALKPEAPKSEAAKAREESRRKMLAEKRRQMQDQGTKTQEEILIFTPENN